MELHYNKPQFQDGILDFHRFVLLVTHRFSDRVRFVSEIEIEHAVVEGLEEGGELELEQAYLDFLLTRGFNLRAGMLLVPLGIINERHEPPVFHGVERPLVDTVIIPTTWFDVGAGVHGEIGRGWRYRAYVMAPLNAAEFSADEGIREGQQHGSEANAGRIAVTGRVEYVGYRGLTIGAGVWSGRSGFEFRPTFDVPVTVGEIDARYARRRIELRGQFAQVSISNADQLNDALAIRTGVNPNIARTLRGFYGEGSYRIVSGARVRRHRALRAVRKRRHTAPDAGGLPAHQDVRSRSVGDRRHVLAGLRHRREGRLRHRAQPRRGRVLAELVQPRTGVVVLMTTRRWHPALAAAGAAVLALAHLARSAALCAHGAGAVACAGPTC